MLSNQFHIVKNYYVSTKLQKNQIGELFSFAFPPYTYTVSLSARLVKPFFRIFFLNYLCSSGFLFIFVNYFKK